MPLKAGPSRVSGSSVSAETVIDEAFVLMGGIVWCFSLLLSRSKGKVEKAWKDEE